MTVWLGVSLTIITLFLGFYYWTEKRQTHNPSGEKTIRLRLGLAMQPSSALVMVALEKGLFAANGLEVSVQAYPSGKRAMHEALFTGRADVITTSDTPIAFAGFERADFKIIASIFVAHNINRIIARKDAGIQKPADLPGKRIATQRASAVHFFLHLFLLENGLSDKTVELSFMKAEALPQALADGKIDAFSMREPYISQAAALLEDKAVIFSAPGIYEQVEGLVVTQNLIVEKPTAVRKLLRAMLQAEEFAMANPELAMTIVAHRLGVKPDSMAGIWPQVRFRIAMKQSLLLLLEEQARWAMRAGLTGHKTVPNYLDVLHLDALEALKPEAISIMR